MKKVEERSSHPTTPLHVRNCILAFCEQIKIIVANLDIS